MTGKFEKAKAETIQKWNRILGAIHEAGREEASDCSFCEANFGCKECPAFDLCDSKLHNEIRDLLDSLESKVARGVDLLEKLEEKPKGKKGG